MDKLEFYIDESGQPCARGTDQRLATYLETDLQGSQAITKTIIEALENQSFRGDINGNGHCVTFSNQTVSIESLFDDEAAARRIKRSDMIKAVQRWLKFIS